MKVVILAGGRGSRLGDKTLARPKPMLEVGGRPMLWHIMRHYYHYDFNDFIVATGYRAEVVRDYFENMSLPWRVTIVDTGIEPDTGGRIKRIVELIEDTTFMLTFGDAVADVDLQKLLEFHRSHGRLATVTAVHPPPRFGHLQLDGDRVTRFSEKSDDPNWINGGYFVMEPEVLDYIENESTSLERECLPRLSEQNELVAFRHAGFWQCMDFPFEYQWLQQAWQSGAPPWRIWQEE